MAAKDKTAQTPDNGEDISEVMEIVNAEVATLRPTQLAVLEMLTGLENIATEDTDASGFTGDDIAAILLAPDEATMWDADERPSFNAKVLSGCDLDVYGYDVKFSTNPDITSGLIGPTSKQKMYLIVRSARITDAGQTKTYNLPAIGDEFVWNTSARFIVAKLYRLGKWGKFDNGTPVKCRIEGTELGAGKSVEKLKELELSTVNATAEPPF